MQAPKLARLGHRWLALVVGIQLVLWTLSGFYMVVVDLDFIHGDPLVRNLAPRLELRQPVVPLASVKARHPDATSVALRALPGDGHPVYELAASDGVVLVDALSGERLSPLPESRVRELAAAYYAGDGGIARATLLNDAATKPIELQERPLPLWRIDFDDWLETSLYLHPDSGRLVVRRHRFWRWFDLFWSLHIMDYQERSDVNNWLLRTSTIVGLLALGSGAWLTFHSFAFLQRRRRRAPVAERSGQPAGEAGAP